jgi:selenocysteine lyase/cysteine desulfurase
VSFLNVTRISVRSSAAASCRCLNAFGLPSPLDGADPQNVRSWLIAERGIVTTYAEVQRALFEMHAPVLRVSPHVDSATENLEAFAEALAEATELLS